MSKKKDEEVTTVETPVRKKPEMKSVAVGLTKKDNVWNLVRIKFDIDSGQVGDVSLQEMEDLGYAFESLKIALEDEVYPASS